MYLEERVGQLENIAVEHGKQIEMVAAGLAALTASVNNGFQEVRSDLRAQDKRMDRLELKVDRLDTRLDRVEIRLDTLETDVAVLKSDVAELKSDVAVLKIDVAELKSDMSAVKCDISVLKGDVEMLKNGFGEMNVKIDKLGVQFAQMTEGIENLVILLRSKLN